MSRRIQQRRSRIHGNGVFAAAAIAAGTRLVEYKGLRRTHEDADERYGDSLDSGHTFLFTLNDAWLIDANVDGNVARWINHSCAPNCQAVLEENAGGDSRRDRVFIESLREIAAGEELTYNYGIRLSVPHTAKLKKQWACRCGAAECTGTMLQPKR
jgi:uncharacterized protein